MKIATETAIRVHHLRSIDQLLAVACRLSPSTI
jgi:hypothetical protein